MQVFVDLCGEGTVSARVQPETTLGDLKWALLQASPEAFMRRYSYFTFLGKPLQDATTISSQGITNHSTLHLRARVLGGGGDGGATSAESRDCYLNMYAVKKPDDEARLAKWSRCALSSEALKPPCVVDLLGNLYNKEALVAALLSKSLPKELKHIKGLKDMVSIHLSSVPGIDADDEKTHTKFQCPVSGQEFNGNCKFYVLRTCGHVLSAKALKEVQSSLCLVCLTPYVESDKLVIYGSKEEVLELRQRMEEGSDEEGAVEHERVGANGAKRKPSKTDKLQAVAEKSRDLKVLQPSKKFKAVDMLPPNATEGVYALFFSSSNKTKSRETYKCRVLPLGMPLGRN